MTEQSPLTTCAGFRRRALAAILDLILLAAPVTWAVKGYLTRPPSVLDRRIWMDFARGPHTYLEREQLGQMLTRRIINSLLLAFFLPALYWIPAECSPLQGTLGKRLLRLRVTGLDGRRIGFRQSLRRYVMRGLSTSLWLTGYAIAAFTSRRQALHDILAGTLVVVAARSADTDPGGG